MCKIDFPCEPVKRTIIACFSVNFFSTVPAYICTILSIWWKFFWGLIGFSLGVVGEKMNWIPLLLYDIRWAYVMGKERESWLWLSKCIVISVIAAPCFTMLSQCWFSVSDFFLCFFPSAVEMVFLKDKLRLKGLQFIVSSEFWNFLIWRQFNCWRSVLLWMFFYEKKN